MTQACPHPASPILPSPRGSSLVGVGVGTGGDAHVLDTGVLPARWPSAGPGIESSGSESGGDTAASDPARSFPSRLRCRVPAPCGDPRACPPWAAQARPLKRRAVWLDFRRPFPVAAGEEKRGGSETGVSAGRPLRTRRGAVSPGPLRRTRGWMGCEPHSPVPSSRGGSGESPRWKTRLSASCSASARRPRSWSPTSPPGSVHPGPAAPGLPSSAAGAAFSRGPTPLPRVPAFSRGPPPTGSRPFLGARPSRSGPPSPHPATPTSGEEPAG